MSGAFICSNRAGIRCCSSYLSSFQNPFSGRNVFVYLSFEDLWSQLPIPNMQVRSIINSVLLHNMQKSRLTTAVCEMQRLWGQSVRLCSQAKRAESWKRSLSKNTHRCLLSARFGKCTDKVFSSMVDLYEINGKYEFHYQVRRHS